MPFRLEKYLVYIKIGTGICVAASECTGMSKKSPYNLKNI